MARKKNMKVEHRLKLNKADREHTVQWNRHTLLACKESGQAWEFKQRVAETCARACTALLLTEEEEGKLKLKIGFRGGPPIGTYNVKSLTPETHEINLPKYESLENLQRSVAHAVADIIGDEWKQEVDKKELVTRYIAFIKGIKAETPSISDYEIFSQVILAAGGKLKPLSECR